MRLWILRWPDHIVLYLIRIISMSYLWWLIMSQVLLIFDVEWIDVLNSVSFMYGCLDGVPGFFPKTGVLWASSSFDWILSGNLLLIDIISLVGVWLCGVDVAHHTVLGSMWVLSSAVRGLTTVLNFDLLIVIHDDLFGQWLFWRWFFDWTNLFLSNIAWAHLDYICYLRWT